MPLEIRNDPMIANPTINDHSINNKQIISNINAKTPIAM